MKSPNLFIRPIRYWIDDLTYRVFADKGPLIELQDRYIDRPILVVGNGPSINDTPLEDFNGIPAIGMNKIDLLFGRSSWRPSIIACANDAVAMQHRKRFAASEIPIFLAWKSRWFMPRIRRNIAYYLNKSSSEFQTDSIDGISIGDTVTFVALQLAYWTGADPVIIFGVDHSYQSQGKPLEYVRWKGPDTNHFDPNYFQEGSLFGNPNLAASEIQYINARKAFETAGRRIYDATVNGKLQIFDKISIDRAKELCGLEMTR
jgi:hypothetical protein